MAKAKAVTAKQDCWRRIGVWGSVFPRCDQLAEVIHCRNCTVFVEAGRGVFERKVPTAYRDEWTTKLLKEDVRESRATVGAFVFRLEDEWFSLPAKDIDGVFEFKAIHRLPHVNNPQIAGVANIGGEILVCYSLDTILEVSKRNKPDKRELKPHVKSFRRFMVVKLNGNRYVFSVDEVRGMTRYDPASLKSAPATIGDSARKFTLGTFALDSVDVTVIDGTAFGLMLEGDQDDA